MPNWVRNIISFESPDLNILISIKDYLDNMNFTKIIPLYDTLNILSSSVSSSAFNLYKAVVIDGKDLKEMCMYDDYIVSLPIIVPKDNSIRYDEFLGVPSDDISYLYENNSDVSDLDCKKPRCRADYVLLGRLQYINLLRYGARDWYEFSNIYWGTKWPTSNIDYKEFSDGNGHMIQYTFNTAWSCPFGIINEILFNFGCNPNLRINIQYADEDLGGGNNGWMIKDYGQMIISLNQMITVPLEDRYKYAETIWYGKENDN
jgi:hypothetical protein